MPLAGNKIYMIAVAEARQLIQSHCSSMPATQLPLADAVGSVLAADLISPVNIPSFRQSSIDGYAIRFVEKNLSLRVADSLPAGTSRQALLPGEAAIKVFTGGPIPDEADTVVQKEWVTEEKDSIRINRNEVEPGAHIRMPGADIQEGIIALKAGTRVGAMHTGFLAGLGITNIPVIAKPRVSIIITGNELVPPGSALGFGQVYESNSFSLQACLRQLQIKNSLVSYAKDDLTETELAIAGALRKADMVILTGGVSVGDHDHVVAACERLGIEKKIHGVKQRPGKPLFFGTKGKQLVFGLPGNPASVLSCFYQYVMPAVQALSGGELPESRRALLAADFEKKPVLTFFLKGEYSNGNVCVLPGQASFQMSSFAGANCWIELPEETRLFSAGSEVIIHPFI